MRRRISTRGCVRPSVHPSVRPVLFSDDEYGHFWRWKVVKWHDKQWYDEWVASYVPPRYLLFILIHYHEIRLGGFRNMNCFPHFSPIFLGDALWARTTKNTDWCTGPLACPFARSLAPLTHLLALHYSLRSLVRLLAHFAHSLTRGTVNYWLAILSVFFSIFDHSAVTHEMTSWAKIYSF